MPATDVVLAQLRCIAQLVRLEPNPTLVEAFLSRGNTLFDTLERSGRWSDLISAITSFARLGEELKEARPDVADTVSRVLGSFWSQGRLAALADLHERDDEGRARVRELARTWLSRTEMGGPAADDLLTAERAGAVVLPAELRSGADSHARAERSFWSRARESPLEMTAVFLLYLCLAWASVRLVATRTR